MAGQPKTVEVSGIPVPLSWSSTRPIQPHSEQMGTSTVVMVMFDDGEHGMAELHVRFNPPVRRSELRTVDLGRLADAELVRKLESAVRSRHANEHGGWFYAEGDEAAALLDSIHSEALRAARGERHYRITDDFLEHVVEVFGAGGADGMARVINEVGTEPSERTVRRWLSEARKRGLR